MYFPLDQSLDGPIVFTPNGFHRVVASNVQTSWADFITHHIQESKTPLVFSEQDIIGSDWQESDDTAPTNKDNSINDGRDFRSILPAESPKEGDDFNEKIKTEAQCDPTRKSEITGITEIQTPIIANSSTDS